MTINLTPDLERALAEAASEQGTTPELLALEYLRERFLRTDPTEAPISEPANLAEFLAGHIGVLGADEEGPGRPDLSQDAGRKFAAGMLERWKQGRL